MKFLILIWSNPASREIWAQTTAEQRRDGFAEYFAINDDLAASGELIATEALGLPSDAVAVGPRLRTDGPFAETKEHLAGFYLIDVVDQVRAVEIAERIPEAPLGLVEVRAVQDLNDLL